MDGVLFDDKNIHFESLNKALGKYAISHDLHLSTFHGLQTRKKLEILSSDFGLPVDLHSEIWTAKQNETIKKLMGLEVDQRLSSVFNSLHESGYKLGVCSNSIRKTVLTVLSNLGIMKYLDIVISNDDVRNPKPHPEMYWSAMSSLDAIPENTLIVEDSPTGLKAARRSGSHVLGVKDPSEVTLENLLNRIDLIKSDHLGDL